MQLFLHISKFCSIFVPEFYKRTIMRNTIDRILRMSIKLCLLTGVAFAFAACYGPAPTDPGRGARTIAQNKIPINFPTPKFAYLAKTHYLCSKF